MRRSLLLLTLAPVLMATMAQAQPAGGLPEASGTPSSGYSASGSTSRSAFPSAASPYGGGMGYLVPQAAPGAVTILPGGAMQFQSPFAVPQAGIPRPAENSTGARLDRMFDPTVSMQQGVPYGAPVLQDQGSAGAASTSPGPGREVPGGATTGTAPDGATAALPPVPGASQGQQRDAAAATAAAAALMQPGETFSGRLHLSSSGQIKVGDRSVTLDGADVPGASEICGSAQMMRCGTVVTPIMESLFARLNLARCTITAVQTDPDAPLNAACTAGRQDVSALLVQSGAARAAGVRLMVYQVEAAADERGLWAGTSGSLRSSRVPR